MDRANEDDVDLLALVRAAKRALSQPHRPITREEGVQIVQALMFFESVGSDWNQREFFSAMERSATQRHSREDASHAAEVSPELFNARLGVTAAVRLLVDVLPPDVVPEQRQLLSNALDEVKSGVSEQDDKEAREIRDDLWRGIAKTAIAQKGLDNQAAAYGGNALDRYLAEEREERARVQEEMKRDRDAIINEGIKLAQSAREAATTLEEGRELRMAELLFAARIKEFVDLSDKLTKATHGMKPGATVTPIAAIALMKASQLAWAGALLLSAAPGGVAPTLKASYGKLIRESRLSLGGDIQDMAQRARKEAIELGIAKQVDEEMTQHMRSSRGGLRAFLDRLTDDDMKLLLTIIGGTAVGGMVGKRLANSPFLGMIAGFAGSTLVAPNIVQILEKHLGRGLSAAELTRLERAIRDARRCAEQSEASRRYHDRFDE